MPNDFEDNAPVSYKNKGIILMLSPTLWSRVPACGIIMDTLVIPSIVAPLSHVLDVSGRAGSLPFLAVDPIKK